MNTHPYFCAACNLEFMTPRGLADHKWKSHGQDATPAPVGVDPTVPYVLNENDRKLLKGLRIGVD